MTETIAGNDRYIDPVYIRPRYINPGHLSPRHISPEHISYLTFALTAEFVDA